MVTLAEMNRRMCCMSLGEKHTRYCSVHSMSCLCWLYYVGLVVCNIELVLKRTSLLNPVIDICSDKQKQGKKTLENSQTTNQ